MHRYIFLNIILAGIGAFSSLYAQSIYLYPEVHNGPNCREQRERLTRNVLRSSHSDSILLEEGMVHDLTYGMRKRPFIDIDALITLKTFLYNGADDKALVQSFIADIRKSKDQSSIFGVEDELPLFLSTGVHLMVHLLKLDAVMKMKSDPRETSELIVGSLQKIDELWRGLRDQKLNQKLKESGLTKEFFDADVLEILTAMRQGKSVMEKTKIVMNAHGKLLNIAHKICIASYSYMNSPELHPRTFLKDSILEFSKEEQEIFKKNFLASLPDETNIQAKIEYAKAWAGIFNWIVSEMRSYIWASNIEEIWNCKPQNVAIHFPVGANHIKTLERLLKEKGFDVDIQARCN